MASNPHADDHMKGLISSIREQTTRLKTNLLTTKASRHLPPHPPSRGEKESYVDVRSNPESERVGTEGEEWTYSKQLIENLMGDNKILREELDDYKRVLKIVHEKCLELKRDLDLEKLKNSELDILREQLHQYSLKLQALTSQNIDLKSKCLSLVEFLRLSTFEASEQEKEDTTLIEKMRRENEFLRDLLQVSRISEAKTAEIDAKLSIEETSLRTSEYDKLVESYRQQRISRKSKSIGIAANKKNYLLEEGGDKGNQGGVWDSFFTAKTDAGKKKAK